MRDKKGRFVKGSKPKVHFKKGHIPWNKGKTNKWGHHSEKAKEKIKKANLGKKYSYETRKKLSIANTGENEFIGFKKLLNKRIRIMAKYLEWRSAVFKRDNYHCQKCGENGYLEVHHIIPLSIIMCEFKIKTIDDARKCDTLWKVGNGISYCGKCHIKKDKFRGINIGRVSSG